LPGVFDESRRENRIVRYDRPAIVGARNVVRASHR
jgi:hypothetical protein